VVIDLSLITAHGIIIEMGTGIKWSNQVGGTMCAHPVVEGLFIPMCGGWFWEDTLCDRYGEYDSSLVATFLSQTKLDRYFRPVDTLVYEVMEIPLILAEAWVKVIVRDDIPNEIFDDDVPFHDSNLQQFAGRTGILTYLNSD